MTTLTSTRVVCVDAIHDEAQSVRSIELSAGDGSPLPPWEPGAHIDLHLPSGLIRQYSLCGDRATPGTYRIAVLREPDGRGGSREVHDNLQPGDRLTIGGPRNNFELGPAPAYLFIAGGIGITPILPMARQAASDGVPWRLVYGGRAAASMAFLTELAAVPGGQTLIVPQDEQGLLDLAKVLEEAPAQAAVYCCGPPGLIDAVLDTATRLRPELPVRFERFSPLEIDTSADGAVEVQLARSGRSLVVPPGVSLLQAVREAGVEVESSCEEGTCGTCECPVLSGIPEHRDSILTEAERAANDVIMLCVSRSSSPLLILDL